MDQSKLPKNNSGQLPHKVVGAMVDQSNDNAGCLQVGGGTTWTVSGLQKAMHVSGGRTGMMIKLDCDAT